jgi:sulfide:quinone oxidoreductase
MTQAERVVICGGGVAAIEALLALRELSLARAEVELVAPGRELVYAPHAVGEPFGLGEVRRFDLAAIADDLGACLHHGALTAVDAPRRRLTLSTGAHVCYDAAIVAVGARRCDWLDGSISFGAGDVRAFSELLVRLESGEVSRLAFAAPPGVSWTLPLYELALLTATRLAERGVAGVEIAVVTGEEQPLAVFGEGAARMLRGQLADRGIRLRVGADVSRFAHERIELRSGETIEAEEVVTIPRPEGPGIKGLECDGEGFALVDDRCRAVDREDVYVAGDGAAFPVKQGGLATQQADVAAEWVAAGLGAPIQPARFEPRLRGVLLTGVAPLYLGAELSETAAGAPEVSAEALSWPATKIAGRYLSPYLSFAAAVP